MLEDANRTGAARAQPQRLGMGRRSFIALSGAALLAGCREEPGRVFAYPRSAAAYPPIGRIRRVNGLNVHATDTGKGGPPVVLIHGASANLRDWSYSLIRPLSARRRVIAMDRPGLGYSERGDGDWSPMRQAAQMRDAVRAMGVRRPILVGHSFGAAVALAWAQQAPGDVRGVVAVAGATMPFGAGVRILSSIGIGRAGVEHYTERLASRIKRGEIGSFMDRIFAPLPPPRRYVRYVGVPLAATPEALRATRQDLGGLSAYLSDLAKGYVGLRTPVEILHGEADRLCDVDRHARGLARALPQARLTLFPKVGHMAHHARPGALEAAIRRLS